MDAVINILVEILRLVPLILVFFIPALFAMAIWRERGESHKVKAILMLTVSCGLVVFFQLVLRSVSATQIAATLAVSLVQIA
nr:hypothetical protein [Actinomycetota bacterium]